MSASLPFVSINIEYDKHLDTVTAFLKEKNPDVFCLQEVLERDVSFFEREFGAVGFFNPMTHYSVIPSAPVLGTCIFSRLPVKDYGAEYYVGAREPIPVFVNTDVWNDDEMSRVVSWCDIEKDGQIFRIATTHFTWTKHGESTEPQRRNMEKVLNILAKLGDFILCGDLNAPRGLATWQMLADRYKDNIPLQYTSSIDPKLHRAAPIKLVVDSLFSTSVYDVRNVEIVCGVSDHCAITAHIAKAPALKPQVASV